MHAVPNGVFGHSRSGVTGKREGQDCGGLPAGADDAAAWLTTTPPGIPDGTPDGRVVFRPGTMALSTFAGGRLWGARYGTAAPWVLALHGWRRDHHDWDEVLEGLDAVALDLPGHGVAPEPPEPWSTRQYAEWVAPALRDLAGGPVVIAGHSFGARVAVQLAAAAGEDSRKRPTEAGASEPSCWWPHRSLRRREEGRRGLRLFTEQAGRSTASGSCLTSGWSSCAKSTVRTITVKPAQ